MQRLAWIALAGALGTVARYVLGGWIQRHWLGSFPSATWVINGSGCFLFGLIWTLGEERLGVPPEWRIVILTGFLGAYTTFSTYMFEMGQLAQDGQWGLVLVTWLGQNLLGFALLMLGSVLARGL